MKLLSILVREKCFHATVIIFGFSYSKGDMSSDFIKKLEDQSDVVLRKTKDYLPFLSRLCLVATFLEVGDRVFIIFSHLVLHPFSK